MTPFIGPDGASLNGHATPPAYTVLEGTRAALRHLLARAKGQLPDECLPHIARAAFSTTNGSGGPYFPSPLKQTEAVSAIKAVEAGVAATIAHLSLGGKERSINVDLERASAFLFSAYLATVGGMGKANPNAKKLLKGQPLRGEPCVKIAETTPRYRSTPGTIDSLSSPVC